MTNMDVKYDSWKNKLLDLGKRNRLMNYRETLRSTIKVTSPDCIALYDYFVSNEKPLVFPLDIEEIESEELNSKRRRGRPSKGETQNYTPNVETNKNIKDLQKALRNIHSRAKTSIEEQGVNVLYLSFGFLEWTEAENSEQKFLSPLILVPAALTIESITSPYVLFLHEDEIVINPTLAYKLENDFGIKLPEFSEDESIDVYFEKVRKKIKKTNWSLLEEASLSLLSFLKINMYADLNNNKKAILSNPVVRAISGDITAVERIPEDFNEYDFDKKEKPQDIFQIVDADASQQDAILMAKKGVSFVLQGPPGTGKSQTITNIIAESLAEGKKVLFVSEKMAALDVVHRRLTSAGLDDFCLVLHSHKANKKSVLEQLGKALDLGNKKTRLSDEAFKKLNTLQRDKDKLNAYSEQVFEVIEPIHKSVYDVNGIIANLSDYDDVIFQIKDIKTISNEEYNRFLYLLDELSKTLGKMSSDYINNPWKECNLKSVTNEFRQETPIRIQKLLSKLEPLPERLAVVYETLGLPNVSTIKYIDTIMTLLSFCESAICCPYEWVLLDDINEFYKEIEMCKKIKQEILDSFALLKETQQNIHKDVLDYEFLTDENELTYDAINKEKEFLSNFIANEKPFSIWEKPKVLVARAKLSTASEKAAAINSIKNQLFEKYELEVLLLDYKGILGRIKTEYTSFTKFFKKSYKEDKKSIQILRKDIVKNISDEEMIYVVEKLKEISDLQMWFLRNETDIADYFGEIKFNEDTDYEYINKQLNTYDCILDCLEILERILNNYESIKESEQIWQKQFGFLYSGITSDWDAIIKALDWAVSFKKEIEDKDIPKEFICKVCDAKEFINICTEQKEKLQGIKLEVIEEYNWFVSMFDSKDAFLSTPISELCERMYACKDNMYALEEWIDYRVAREKCNNAGLDEFVDKIQKQSIPVEHIVPIFKKRFFTLWLDAILPEYPAVLNFRRKSQETTIKEFSSLDKTQFEIAKARIKAKLISDLPSLDHLVSGLDEISILKRELAKQRRIMPIRKLFREIPNLLLTLKPCLMMSPLSVSLFLETSAYQFDIVIFDEASQVCTENAIGAISRAKQVVIAGDSKQLPPTNFFQAAMSDSDFDIDDDEDEYSDINAYESILDEANMLPERTLRWHYRSRHEGLIAFSNSKIYKNNLITFPSNIEQSKDAGVEYIYVSEGFYDRGGRKGNVPEAQKVVELIFEHFKKNPNKSLGVITFGEVQQQAIETTLRERRIADQSFEEFFSEEKDEPFFVKNLENVQGDERDVIIFSIGYAKDATGVFRMNFGPLSKQGGERRLNVAITRAKYNIKLVGSIVPTDINVEKINSEGPKLLRGYIDFAMNGSAVLENEITVDDYIEHDSPFEEAVYDFLINNGYKVKTQVGCSGYRIDMAVMHPTLSGTFVLGVECDGAAYHSARTARERDRLRQDVLENMGWKIYRIWSTDWIKHQNVEGQKLLEAVEDAISRYGIIEGSSDSDSNDGENKTDADDFVDIEELSEEEKKNIYDFSETLPKKPLPMPNYPSGTYPWAKQKLNNFIKNIYEEYPIHFEYLCQKLAKNFGKSRASKSIKDYAESNIRSLKNMGCIKIKDGFISPAKYDTIPIRLPNTRKIQYISTEELSEAMCIILKKCVGPTSETLCMETARVYGFKKTGTLVLPAMEKAVKHLLRTKQAIKVDGKIKLAE